MKSQRESVFAAVCLVCDFPAGSKVEPTKEQRAKIVELVVADFKSNQAVLSDDARAKFDTDAKLKTYTSGLVSNWLRKDIRLNGGEKYEAKNPGSRAGQGDDMLKNLKALRSQLTDTSHIAAVDEKIAEREAELAKTKAKTVTINVDAIPEDLRYLLDNVG